MILKFLIFTVFVVRAEIPSYIKICKGDDPQVENCIKKSIEGLKDMLASGIPEQDVPSLDPFHFKEIIMEHNPGSNVKDMDISGASNFDILELNADLDKMRFSGLVHFPELTFSGKYSADFRILIATIKGSGKITGKFPNLKLSMLLKARKYRKEGNTYLRFDPIKVTILFNETYVHLDNLFGGQKALGDATNDLINETPEPFIEELVPSLEKGMSETLTEIANKIVSHYTYEELFPKS